MKKLILAVLLLISSVYAEQTIKEQCYVRGIYKICGTTKTKLLPKPKLFEWDSRDEQVIEEQLAVFTRKQNDAPERGGWDEYFILDYKNMMVYDKDCLKGNYATVEDGELFYNVYGSGKHIPFKKQDFEHCKQPLKAWLKKPYKPY